MKLILILENGKTIKDMISNDMIIKDYKILESGSSLTKSTFFREQIPDLVIADLTSIKKEKVELLMMLKNNPVTSFVPFLLITSPAGLSTRNKNDMKEQVSAFNNYLQKPFSKDELIVYVKKILKHSDNLSPW